MNFQFAPDSDDAGSTETNAGSGFWPLCDSCSFTTSKCISSFEEVKRLCDDHNTKNPGHDAAPVACSM